MVYFIGKKVENIKVLEKPAKQNTSDRKKSKVNKIVPEEEIHEILPQVETTTKKTATSNKVLHPD